MNSMDIHLYKGIIIQHRDGTRGTVTGGFGDSSFTSGRALYVDYADGSGERWDSMDVQCIFVACPNCGNLMPDREPKGRRNHTCDACNVEFMAQNGVVVPFPNGEAALPDLLSAAEALVELEDDSYGGHPDYPQSYAVLVDRFRKALATARGGDGDE